MWAVLPSLAAFPFAVSQHGIAAFGEGGLIETMQSALLLVAVGTATVMTAVAGGSTVCRRRTMLLGLIAMLLLARELDWHVALNPEWLGEFGVRYRIDWWLDGTVAWSLKLGWAAAALIALAMGVYMARGAIGPVDWYRARPRLLVLALVGYAGGFVFDDLLRDSFSGDLRQPIEEMFELFATACILGAVLAPESSGADASEIERSH